VLHSVTTFIEKKSGLIVNAEKSKISRLNRTKFLGFYFYFDSHTKKYQAMPHKDSTQKFQCKLRQLTKRNRSISLDRRIIKLKQVIHGWINYFRKAKMKGKLKEIDAKFRLKIRVIIWKHWKNDRKRICFLVQLGIPEEAKGLTYCRKGDRFIGLSKVVQRALSSKRLKQSGMPFSLDYYL
jgi:RNA-directed DNA polymerase